MNFQQRLRASLRGNIPGFPGDTLPEQLLNGQRQAQAILESYVGPISFDVDAAQQASAEIDVWLKRNEAALDKLLGESPDTQLPAEMALQIGREKMQQWVIAQLVMATDGLGPWMSGRVAEMTTRPGTSFNDLRAYDDAQMRLEMFGSIVRMEQTGDLAKIFAPAGTSGFGEPLSVGALIVIALLGLAAIIAVAVVIHNQVTANSKILAEECRAARAQGDQKTIDWCHNMLKARDPIRIVTEETTKAGVVLLGGFLLIRFGLPFLLDLGDKRRLKAKELSA